MLVIDKLLWLLVDLAFAWLGNISIYKFLCLYVSLLFVIDAHVARLNKQIEKLVFPNSSFILTAVR